MPEDAAPATPPDDFAGPNARQLFAIDNVRIEVGERDGESVVVFEKDGDRIAMRPGRDEIPGIAETAFEG